VFAFAVLCGENNSCRVFAFCKKSLSFHLTESTFFCAQKYQHSQMADGSDEEDGGKMV
jgi:hypothetical protein